MTLGPILVSGKNPIIGTLRVPPYNYPDSVNGTLHDPTWTTRDKNYIAYVDDTNPGTNVGFTKTGPFWSLHPNIPVNNSDVKTNLEYWNCGKLEHSITVPFIHSSSPNPFCSACVDGNGFFYQHGVKPHPDPDYLSFGISVVRRIKRDGTYVTVNIDWAAIMPSWTLPSGHVVDPYENVNYQIYPDSLSAFLPQNDGVLIRCKASVFDPGSTPAGRNYQRQMWVYVDENGTVGTPWWEPTVFVFGTGDITVGAACPLGEGYIGGRDSTFGFPRIFKVNQSGTVTVGATTPGAPTPFLFKPVLNGSTFGSTSHTFQTHEDGSFWIGNNSALSAGSQYLLSSSLVDITPAWVAGIKSQVSVYAVTAVPPSDPAFRMVTYEFVSGVPYHRVRDASGNVLVEARQGSGGAFTDAMYGLRSNKNCFIYRRAPVPGGQYGASNNGMYKFTADNLISVCIAPGRLTCYSRGEFPHFDYSDWPLT